jgi:hypothetical protein
MAEKTSEQLLQEILTQKDAPKTYAQSADLPAAPPEPETKWRFDENAFRLAGGMIGGTIGAPTGPGALLAAGVGAETFGQGARTLNMFLDNAQQILPDDITAGAVDLAEKTTEAGVNIISDMMMGGLFSRVAQGVKQIPRRIFGEETNRLAKVSTENLAEVFTRRGIPKSAGVFGGPIVKGSEVGLSKLPTSAKIVQNSIDDTLGGIERLADDTIRTSGGTVKTPEFAGKSLTRSVNSWVEQSKNEVSKKFLEVGKAIPKGTNVKMNNTLAAIDDLTGGQPSGLEAIREIQFPAGINKTLSAINSSAPGKKAGEMAWSDAAKLRTGLGELIGDPNVNTKTRKQMLKKIQTAMLADMQLAAEKVSPQARQLWDNAREFTKNFHQKKQIVSSVANSSMGREAFESAIRGSAKTPEMLRELKTIVGSVDRKAGDKVWNDFVSTYLFEFSRATPSAQTAGEVADFSIHQFLKNFNKLKKTGADKVLFSGQEGLRESLSSLEKASAAVKDISRFANPSGTASQNQFMNVLTGRIALGGLGAAAGTEFADDPGQGALIGAGAALIAPWAFGRLIMNWLAKGRGIAPRDVDKISTHLGRLVNITSVEPHLKDSIEEYLDTYRGRIEMEENIKNLPPQAQGVEKILGRSQ